MKQASSCLRALVASLVLMTGCAGIERAPQRSPLPAAPADAIVQAEPRVIPATPVVPPRSPAVTGAASASTPLVSRAHAVRPASAGGALAQPAAPPPGPPKVAAPPSPVVVMPKAQMPMPAPAQSAGPPPLDLKALETRLKETKAIGVLTKLTLKNQIDDLLERFRAFYQGRIKTSLAELRRSFDMLVMKTLALLQDADPPLAGALASSRESIWGILSDPAKFATV